MNHWSRGRTMVRVDGAVGAAVDDKIEPEATAFAGDVELGGPVPDDVPCNCKPFQNANASPELALPCPAVPSTTSARTPSPMLRPSSSYVPVERTNAGACASDESGLTAEIRVEDDAGPWPAGSLCKWSGACGRGSVSLWVP